MFKFFKNDAADASQLADSSVCAISINRDGTLVDQSRSSKPIAAAWKSQNSDLIDFVERVRRDGPVAEARFRLNNGARYSLTGIMQRDCVLVVANETTVADKMTEALLESRSLMKGLLDRAVDLSFEVDADRQFTFLSPTNAFGQSLDGWLGRRADELFWQSGHVPARNPFSSRKETEFAAVSVSFDESDNRWVNFSVEPVFSDDGAFGGVRGVCRDVSDQVEDGRQTRSENLRLTLQQRIVNLLNTTHSSEELLDRASSELREVLRAEQVWAVIKFPEGLVPAAVCGESTFLPNIDRIWQQLESTGDAVSEVQDDDMSHLVVRLEEADKGIGMLVLCRDSNQFPWSSQEKTLLADIIGSLAAAFGKAQLINRLERLSSIDELTGIMNRRAFVSAMERRLQHQSRSGQSGCLLFVDLDHFKEVNDTLGHKAGDQAIQLVADTMQAVVRACDIVGRYGGDEFVLWLEDIEPGDAALKARSLIEAMPGIREKIGGGHLQLSASVGVCASVPGLDLKFTDLSERADEALYEVKNAGRSNVAMARTPLAAGKSSAGGLV